MAEQLATKNLTKESQSVLHAEPKRALLEKRQTKKSLSLDKKKKEKGN